MLNKTGVTAYYNGQGDQNNKLKTLMVIKYFTMALETGV